jgi:Ca2+-binding RTX toxin-like protein
VNSLAGLDAFLAGTISNPVGGSLVTGGIAANLGADGGFVKSILINGVTYTYNPAGTGSITVTGGTGSFVFDTAKNEITVTTTLGGKFVVDMDDGTYKYLAPGSVAGTLSEVMGFTMTDRDGDTQSSSITVNVTQTTPVTGAVLNGDAAANTITGGASHDQISGLAGNDTLSGAAGNDRINGGDGNDVIIGGTGIDQISGGKGNDTLTGGDLGLADTTSDVFIWNLNDQGTTAAPAIDTVNFFNNTAANVGGDVLSLKDLLVGETAATLNKFLHFSYDAATGNTTLFISANGSFTAGHNTNTNYTDVNNNDTQQIVFNGVNLTNGFATDQDLINDLIARGKLITD